MVEEKKTLTLHLTEDELIEMCNLYCMVQSHCDDISDCDGEARRFADFMQEEIMKVLHEIGD